MTTMETKATVASDDDVLRVGPTTPLLEVERQQIFRALAHFSGNKTKTAHALGIDTKTLYNKLKRYGAEDASPTA